MEALDGNAIAGELFAIFGREMTTAKGTCTQCRTTAQVAELSIYARAPGTVARCRNCGSVALVLLNIHGAIRLHHDRFRLDDQEPVERRPTCPAPRRDPPTGKAPD